MRVEIEKLVQGGYGLARTSEGVLFIPGALPGESVSCSITGKKKNFSFAVLEELHSRSPLRRDPICSCYPRCGGCNLQHVTPEGSAELKEGILLENLERLGGFHDLDPVKVVQGNESGCRKRVRYQVQEHALGFFRAGSHVMEAITHCPMLTSPLNTLLKDPESTISRSKRVAGGIFAAANEVEAAVEEEPIVLQMGTKEFSTIPKLFFQSNPDLFVKLLEDALTGVEGGQAVDLYSGVGVIAAFLADRFNQVTAVEGERLCREFAGDNLPDAVTIISQSVEKWISRKGVREPDLLVVDPPRDGLSKNVRNAVCGLKPKRLLYISCNPATFSRDLKDLTAAEGFSLERIGAYDLYANTSHLETFALLNRNG